MKKQLTSPKIIFFGMLLLILGACDSEDVNDCLQTEGNRVSVEVPLANFNTIRIEEGVSLLLKQGPTQRVVLETGENLQNDIDVRVDDQTLVARDNNGCNFIRDYNATRLVVTSPNIVEVVNGSSFDVESDGVLNYPEISLRSLVIIGLDLKKNGTFRLQLNSETVSITANGSSVFYLSGEADNLNVSFSDELPRLEANNLVAQNVSLRHVSSNHMFINPIQSLTAELRGSGNVYTSNRPPDIDIVELYTGRVFFTD